MIHPLLAYFFRIESLNNTNTHHVNPASKEFKNEKLAKRIHIVSRIIRPTILSAISMKISSKSAEICVGKPYPLLKIVKPQ